MTCLRNWIQQQIRRRLDNISKEFTTMKEASAEEDGLEDSTTTKKASVEDGEEMTCLMDGDNDGGFGERRRSQVINDNDNIGISKGRGKYAAARVGGKEGLSLLL